MKNKTRFKYVLTSYLIIYLVLIITLFIITFIIMSDLILRNDKNLETVLSNDNIVEIQNDFTNVDYYKLFGKGSYVEIIDENNDVVYSKNNDIRELPTEFSYDLKGFIPKVGTYTEVDAFNSNSKNGYVISHRYWKDNDLVEYNEIVVDKDYNVIYTTYDYVYPKLNETSFNFLCGIYNDKIDVFKFNFSSEEKEYTLLLFLDFSIYNLTIKRQDAIILFSILAYILTFVILTIIFIVAINRKVKTPLKIINDCITDYDKEITSIPVKYQSMIEFNKIINSFDELKRKIKTSENQKQEIIAGISHDLKTPITVIEGYVKAINEGLISKDDEKKYLNIISLKINRLNELINLFSIYSKLDHPDFKLELSRIDINEFLVNYFASKYSDIELNEFDIDINISNEKISCDIDLNHFTRAIDNIINNSFKYNSKGTTIYAKTYLKNEKINIVIGDDGVGLDTSMKEKIFLPFIMNDKSRNSNSSGLGLSITKRIIELHNGTINLLNTTDKGIYFIITLLIKK